MVEDTGEYGANGILDIENFVIFSPFDEETICSFDSLDVLDVWKKMDFCFNRFTWRYSSWNIFPKVKRVC